jgi:ribosomal protein S20
VSKDGKRDAMKDLIAAVKAGDADKAALAFQRAHEACAYDKDEEDDESEEN